MNYRQLWIVLNRLHQTTEKHYIGLIIDIIQCGIKYQAGYMDYELFAMYDLTASERATILTRGKNNQLIRKYNDSNERVLFSDKGSFNQMFDSYLKRDWILLKDNKWDFEQFIKNKVEIIAKPINGTCGHGIEKITVANHPYLYEELIAKHLLLVEEVIKQSLVMRQMYDQAVNTIRFVSIYQAGKTHLICAYLRIGNGDVVDNFNHGGMVAPIDIKTGVITHPAADKIGGIYQIHPDTKTRIKGFQLPDWDQVIQLVKEVAPKVPKVGLVGWDIALTPTGPVIVEGNDFPGHDIYQLPPHRDHNQGLWPLFTKIME